MTLEIIPWSEFQVGIAPLWNVDDPATIPILNNPYRIIRYPVQEWRDRIIFFPCRWVVKGEAVAYTSIYNVSDEVTRIRGIYVLPEHRGRGYGHMILRAAMECFPEGFHRTVGFWREDSAPGFVRHSSMAIVPGTDWFWSDYSGVNMRLLYRDRGPHPGDLTANRLFIEYSHETYGLGGTNNLDRAWSDDEWTSFAAPHEFSYPDGKISLTF